MSQTSTAVAETVSVNLRITASDLRAIDAAARRVGLSRSAFLRLHALKAARGEL